MCRNIKTLFNFEPPAADDELRAAALQYVRKISGFNTPSKTNQPAFEEAVQQITEASRALLNSLTTAAPPRDREAVKAKAIAAAKKRFDHSR